MQTRIPKTVLATDYGREAERILRTCVHCGFCNATCPTYQLLGDELDGPRGRIYQIKGVLEGERASARTRLHLDRCLTCRACETTCPSGVQYGHLVDIGRELVERQVPRSRRERTLRAALRSILSNRRIFTALLRTGQWMRPLLPASLRARVPAPRPLGPSLATRPHKRSVILLDGCVQPALAPQINAATARVLDALGIAAVTAPRAGCCGAVSQHLSAPEQALDFARRNIDAWWPLVEDGAEALVMTASGCGAMVRDYGYLLRNDPAYAPRAARISSMTRDIVEVVANEDVSTLGPADNVPRRIAFQSPCTLQHGQQLGGVVEGLLSRLGFELTPVADSHLCCGSAGTYSILQRDLSERLRTNKLSALQAGSPALIATANIGCLHHLQSATDLPVRHWIELLA